MATQPLSVYDFTVAPFTRGLRTFDHLLDVASQYAKSKNLDPSAIPNWTLHPNMKPANFQVFLSTVFVKGTAERLTGKEFPAFKETEFTELKTLEQMKSRIQHAISILESVDRTLVVANGSFPKTLTLRMGRSMEFTPEDFVLRYAMPNFFFHLQTFYAILRAKGVELGKMDYLSAFLDLGEDLWKKA